MTAYICPDCGGFMSVGLKCQSCGAQWGEDNAEMPCPACGSFEYLDIAPEQDLSGEACPKCGVNFNEWYLTHPAPEQKKVLRPA